MRKLVILRRLSQIIFSSIFIYILWSTTYPLKSFFSSQIIFKIDPLVMFLTALAERVIVPGLIFSVMMVVLTAIFGRFFCGWMCPMGSWIDFISLVRRKKQERFSESTKAKISRPKFFILLFIFVVGFLGIQIAWILDPIVMAARVISLNVIPAMTLAVDRGLQFFIQRFGFYEPFYDFYRFLKSGILGVNVHFFTSSLLTLGFFLIVTACAIFISRLWCRMLCPLGAFYALNARASLLKRRTEGCTFCGQCTQACRMGAIKENGAYHPGECILCMDCVYACPQEITHFSFFPPSKSKQQNKISSRGISRRDFILLLGAIFPLLGFKTSQKSFAVHPVVRPPGALPEAQFVDSCVRCGNCMKVCLTNGLQPVTLESGLEGLWTPQLVPEIGYCEYNCHLCGDVCPTQAIKKLSLEDKQKAKLGIAEIDKTMCIAWAENKECIVCEEHCPVPEKAIKSTEQIVDGKKIFKPRVDEQLCVGCGICQNKCPTKPLRAIRVNPKRI